VNEAKLARRVSNAIAVVSALLVATSAYLSFTNPPLSAQDEADVLFNLIIVVGFAIYVTIGCLIVRRQPRNTIGWLLLAVQGMADRLDGVGGELEPSSSPGPGTTVQGRVPVVEPR
jgi:hypothetical protein